MTEIKAHFKAIEINPVLIYYSGHGVMELDVIDSMSIVTTDGELVDISYNIISKLYKSYTQKYNANCLDSSSIATFDKIIILGNFHLVIQNHSILRLSRISTKYSIIQGYLKVELFKLSSPQDFIVSRIRCDVLCLST